jgi:hypothetical protein
MLQLEWFEKDKLKSYKSVGENMKKVKHNDGTFSSEKGENGCFGKAQDELPKDISLSKGNVWVSISK